MTSCTSILVYNKKILLILRDNNSDIPEPNTWQLPGGGTEAGEDHYQTIKRELQEEINMIPKQLKYLGSVSSEAGVFFAFLTNEEVKEIRLGNEGQGLDFFTPDDALKLNLTRKLRFYLEHFEDGIIELIKTGSVTDVSRVGLSGESR